jgi:hypothetical protein
MRRVPEQISSVALIVGVGAYVFFSWLMPVGVMAFLHWQYGPVLPTAELKDWFAAWHFWKVLWYGKFLFPGLLAGLIAGRGGFIHGLIVGAIAPLLGEAYSSALLLSNDSVIRSWESILTELSYNLVHGLSLTSIGGLTGSAIASALRRVMPSNRTVDADARKSGARGSP